MQGPERALRVVGPVAGKPWRQFAGQHLGEDGLVMDEVATFGPPLFKDEQGARGDEHDHRRQEGGDGDACFEGDAAGADRRTPTLFIHSPWLRRATKIAQPMVYLGSS